MSRPEATAPAGGDARAGTTAGPAASRPPLYTRAFLATALVNLLCFGQWFSLQPIIPLLVVDIGGDAALAGVAYACYSIPSILFRPVFGQLADRVGARRVLIGGTLIIGLSAPAYLLRSLPVILGIRVVHGIGWGGAMTAAPSLMARIAPASRRGEAAGIFDLMPGLAQVVMPAVGLLVLAAAGWTGIFTMAAAFALAACAVAVVAFPPDQPKRAAGTSGRLPMLEPAAVVPMGVTMLFMSASALFVVYPPLLAREHGIPVTDLAAYYPVYGAALVTGRLAMSRVIDRLPRARVVLVGAALAGAALVIASQADSVAPLAVAGACYALAVGASGPAMTAAVIDHAPPDRIGSAMGTYTLGYQFASGFGAALWGFFIQAAGFGPAYVTALVAQAALVVVVLRFRKGIERPVAQAAAS